YLSFCVPGQHKRWLEDWRNDTHGQGLTTNNIYLLIKEWWSSFWITSYRKDYIWCYTLAELLDEIDYVLSTITIMEFNVCFSALPLSLIYKAG
ncbi:TPA: plasmid SOS inhibition protein A, partial [Klebsiella pneumoniae]|nr:plasmid SOS inhibition protein A [Escherichia coli]HBY9023444.1 plasmid SOS inhibition protein A [Klebsiella pneumoniae]HBY9035222.1 plasmid SOS inhibition protein A [Klebsiella pneumoniae]